MIARLFIVTGMLQLTVCASAQVRGITETGAIDAAAETGMVNAKRNVIKNVSGNKIEAIHVTFLCTTKDGRVQSDENGGVDKVLQYDTDHLIPPGGTYVAKVIEPGKCTARTDAVVYANGEAEGDADKIDVIFQRRTGAYQALSVVIPLLDDIASGQSEPSDVIATLRGNIQALSNDRSLSGEEITGEGAVFGQTINLLQTRAWLRTPSDGTPNRQARVEDLMQSKGISLEQSHAFVTANKYREWQSALKDHTTPPGGN